MPFVTKDSFQKDYNNIVPELGKTVLFLGIVLVIIGVFLINAQRIPFLGKLHGDIFFSKNGFTFYFPLATSILLSIIVSTILYFFRK